MIPANDYFTADEFHPSAGNRMNTQFMKLLINARKLAKVPFIINSGFRTKADTERLIREGYEAVRNSAHESGRAADIKFTEENWSVVIASLIKAGFKRLGIGNFYIHIDNDPGKPTPSVWSYKDTPGKLVAMKAKILELIKEQPDSPGKGSGAFFWFVLIGAGAVIIKKVKGA